MHITIEPKNFYEITEQSDIQNLSNTTDIFYAESIGEPPLNAEGYIEEGFILVPKENVTYNDDVVGSNGYLYNPSNAPVTVEIEVTI